MFELTFGLIKSGALARGQLNAIFSRIREEGGVRVAVNNPDPDILRAKLVKLYAEHEGKPFHARLINSVTEPLAQPFCLGGENVVARWRELMGATDPMIAAKGTIRKDFGLGLPDNAVHGSDSPERALIELDLFGFNPPFMMELFSFAQREMPRVAAAPVVEDPAFEDRAELLEDEEAV